MHISHDTRQKEKIHVIPHRLTVRQHSIKIYGVKLLNLSSQYIIESPTYLIFKRRYKRYLLDTLWLICYCVANYHLFIYSCPPPIPSPNFIYLFFFVMYSLFFSLIHFVLHWISNIYFQSFNFLSHQVVVKIMNIFI